jgi:hypothetical protein
VKHHAQGLLLALSAVAAFTPTEAQQTSGPSVTLTGRPASVPSNYVPTPNGWFHPDCIITTSENEMIAADGSIAERSTGAFVRAVPSCSHTRYDGNGNAVSPTAGIRLPTAHQWLVDGQAGVGWMDFISANWVVPPNPPLVNGVTLYFFPGFLPASEDQVIQPVLGWNAYGNGSTAWTLASWECCIAGNTYQSAQAAVSAGVQVYGFAWGTNCNTTSGICGNWEVSTQATGVNPVTIMSATVGEAMSLSVAAAYEEYGITSCAQHPSSESITFSNITAREVGDIPVSPTWQAVYYSFTPTCNINFSSPNSSTATISWCVPMNPCTPSTCGQVLSDGCGGHVTCPACCKLPNVQCGCGLGCLNFNICHRECP